MTGRAARTLLLILVFFIPISTAAVEITFGGLLVCLAVDAAMNRKRFSPSAVRHFLMDPLYMPLTVFFLILGVSIFFSRIPLRQSAEAWLFKWGEWLLLFVFIRRWVRKEDLKTFLLVFLASAFLVSADGMWQRMTGVDFLRGYPLLRTNDFTAVTASFHFYNNFGSYLAAAFFLCFGVFMAAEKKSQRLVLAGGLALILANLVLTYSRGSWVSVWLAAFAVYGLLGNRASKAAAALLSTVLLAAVLAVPAVRERLFFIVTSGGDEQRFEVWRAAWRMFLESPWTGLGVGSFMKVFPAYAAQAGLEPEFHFQYAHNSYLQIMVESGVFALAAFLWFLYVLVKTAVTRAGTGDPVFLGLLAAFAAVSFHAFLDVHFYSFPMSALFWTLAGIILPAAACRGQKTGVAH